MIRAAAAALLLALSCTSGPEPAGGLPSSPHYHGLSAGTAGLVLVAHDAVYRSSDGRDWLATETPTDHALAALAGPVPTVGGEGGAWRTSEGAWDRMVTGTVQALASSEDAVYAWVLGRGLVHLASDETIQSRGLGPDDGITALAAGGGRIYAAGTNFGLFASDDGGRTWNDLEAPGPVTAVTLAGDVVFAGGADAVWRGEGEEWSRTALEPAGPVAALAWDGDLLWALQQGGALHRSADGGRTWSLVARA